MFRFGCCRFFSVINVHAMFQSQDVTLLEADAAAYYHGMTGWLRDGWGSLGSFARHPLLFLG